MYSQSGKATNGEKRHVTGQCGEHRTTHTAPTQAMLSPNLYASKISIFPPSI